MESIRPHRDLIVKQSPIHGYGVFAGENINSGDIIEACYAVNLDGDAPGIRNYTFDGDGKTVMVLGYGAIYNHSATQVNAYYKYDKENSVMVFSATRNIEPGEEIFISYGDSWFSERKAIVREPSWRYRAKSWFITLRALVRGALMTGLLILLVVISQLYVATHV